jgi:uncharacterized protein (DUF2267 family)
MGGSGLDVFDRTVRSTHVRIDDAHVTPEEIDTVKRSLPATMRRLRPDAGTPS